jgi:hypothetical protein
VSYAIYHFAQFLPGLLKAFMRFYGWMKIPTLAAAVTMIAVTVPLDVTFGQTTPKQEAAKIPSDLLALLQNNLKEDELEETKSCLEREGLSWGEILRATRFDLDRPRRGWLLEGLGPCLVGNANDLKLLYIRADDGWRKILDEFGQSLVLCAQAVPPCPVPSRSTHRSTTHTAGLIWPSGNTARQVKAINACIGLMGTYTRRLPAIT